MSKKISLSLVCSTTFLLASCASTTIYPGPNGNYSLVTTSSEQGYAQKDARKKAAEYCQSIGKNLVVINHQTNYNGADKNNAALIGLASSIFTPDAGNPAKSNQDYEVKMNFRCE